MGVLGVLGTLRTLDLDQKGTSSNFDQLPEKLKSYGQENLSICYNPKELELKAEQNGMTPVLKTIFSDQIKKEKNYENRLKGSVQLLGLTYCGFFTPEQIKNEETHKGFLKALQGLELETLILDQAIDNPKQYKDLDLRSTNGRTLYSIITDDFIETLNKNGMHDSYKIKSIQEWNKLLGQIYIGQSIDLQYTGIGPIPEKEYLHMIQKTTAKFVEFSAYLAALQKNLPDDEIEAAKNYGFTLGTSFQIRDDWEDMEKDIREGKSRAFVTEEALDLLTKEEAEFIKNRYNTRKEEIIQIIKNSKIPEYVKELNNRYVSEASKHAENIRDTDTKTNLKEIANIIKI